MVFLRKLTIFIGMKTGVYKILNTVNGNFYIGSTAWNLRRRWGIHRRSLLENKHPNQHLQYAWNKYGELAFVFEIVEECVPSQCLIREQHYIDTLKPSYNILTIAGSVRGYKHSAATKRLIGDASRGENNPFYSGQHTFYHPKHGIFTGSIVDFGKTFGMRKSLPYKLTQGVLSKSHGWIYIGKHPLQIPSNLKTFYHDRCQNNRPTYQFCHMNGTIFTGTMPEFIARYNLDRSVISKLVRGKRKYAYGWIIKT